MSLGTSASEEPLATQLRELWARVDAKDITRDAATAEQERLLGEYRRIWAEALRGEGETDLTHSILSELGRLRGTSDLSIVRSRCEGAVQSLKSAWNERQPARAPQVERFYDKTELFIDELMWWHTLEEDLTPLAYVAALKFAAGQGAKEVLDFGSGVGSGGLLFARHGFSVTLADISSVMLDFCRWRFAERNVGGRFIDLKAEALPRARFDFITAMDVFEHLTDPVGAVDMLAEALKPGGHVYGRFAAEIDPERPMHIVQDFEPVFARFEQKGLREVWRDDWLWGHQVFRKPD